MARGLDDQWTLYGRERDEKRRLAVQHTPPLKPDSKALLTTLSPSSRCVKKGIFFPEFLT